MDDKSKYSDFSNKIMEGVRLAISRLVEKAKANDEELVIVKDGKLVHIKARSLK